MNIRDNIKKIASLFLTCICNYNGEGIIDRANIFLLRKRLGRVESDAVIGLPQFCTCPEKIFLYKNTNIYKGLTFIASPSSKKGRFIMKENSGAASNLTIITNNHGINHEVGVPFKVNSIKHILDEDEDVVIEEDVWIAANVIILSGVTVGRGAVIGAGSVLRKNIPPYAIVMGDPAKVIGFKFTPEEALQHENILYKESERYSLEILECNYNKYFIEKIKDIRSYTSV